MLFVIIREMSHGLADSVDLADLTDFKQNFSDSNIN